MAATEQQILQARLTSKETVYLGHSLKKAASKCLSIRTPDPTAIAAAKRDLDLYNLEIDKAELVTQSLQREMAHYQALEESVKAQVTQCEVDLEKLTADLRVAKKERQHKEEYEALATVVDSHASKPESRAAAARVEADMAALAVEKVRLDRVMEMRKKQFSLLLAAEHDLELVLDEDPFEARPEEAQAAARRERSEESTDTTEETAAKRPKV